MNNKSQTTKDPPVKRSNPNASYIKVELKFPKYKKYHICALIDTGASMCVADGYIIPQEKWEYNTHPTHVKTANGNTTLTKVARDIEVKIAGDKFYIPVIHQQNGIGVDMLIGNNFLNLYSPMVQTLEHISLYNKFSDLTIWIPKLKYVFNQASASFLASLEKQKRGEVKTIQKPPIEFVHKLQIEENIFIDQINKHNYITKLLKEVSSENPIDKVVNTSDELAEIKLIDPQKVIRVKPMSYTPKDREIFAEQIKELSSQGLIRPSQSPHSSPAFLVENHAEIKRGKKRMVINYKEVNKNTVYDGYFLPNKESLLTQIRNKKVFSGLDCKSGFHQLRLKEESKPITAFSCPQGHYEWNVLAFGLKQAPGLFQRYMDKVFKDYSDFCCVYVDDLLVHSKTEQEHYEHLEKILKKCKEKGIVLSEKKAQLCTKEINFLGLNISEGELKMQDHVLNNIQAFPSKMEDKKQLQRFLGILNYAEGYIKKLAEWRKPLQSKLKKDYSWKWEESDTNYVEKIKRNLKSLPTLYHPKEDDKMIIETDASKDYWGGILKAQKPAPDWSEHLCRYTSGTFQGAELNYHSNEKEYLAIKKTIKKFSIYLIDKEFEIRTDSKNFGSFLRTNIAGDYKHGRLLRWQQWFNHYQFKVTHIAGDKNSLADSLTREIAGAKEEYKLT